MFPRCRGLQHVILGAASKEQHNKFKRAHLSTTGDVCVQILHEKPLHWVWCAVKGSDVYFGNTKGIAPTTDTQRAMLRLFADLLVSNKLNVNMLHVQQQKDDVSCGVYCIASALLAAAGTDMQIIASADFGGDARMWDWIMSCWRDNYLRLPDVSNRRLGAADMWKTPLVIDSSLYRGWMTAERQPEPNVNV